MTDSAVLVKAANLIAENAVLAFERERDGAGFHQTGRDTAIQMLVRELLTVMPTGDGYVLAAACNRGLDQCEAMGMPGPRVLVVDPGDGAVTMRSA